MKLNLRFGLVGLLSKFKVHEFVIQDNKHCYVSTTGRIAAVQFELNDDISKKLGPPTTLSNSADGRQVYTERAGEECITKLQANCKISPPWLCGRSL